jgi:hypothetical protein
MTRRSQEPIPRVPMCVSDRHLDLPYERLASLRAAFAKVRDSDFLWQHERTHLEEVIERIDLTVSLKRQREEYQADKSKSERTAQG